MQTRDRISQGHGDLRPPPPLGFGFPAPGSYTGSALDSPTLGNSTHTRQPVALPRPPADVLEENYKSAVTDGRTGGTSGEIPQSRTFHALDPSDAVVMHLLVETAVDDSLRYEVLPFEEVESLKKEQTRLVSRMDAAGQKLALETKMRDAVRSLSRLDGNTDHRRSSSRQSSQTDDGIIATANELSHSAAKCDELAHELWQMERRYRLIENQLLKHTAGILQMTHKGPTRRTHSRPSLPNGAANRPDSPASSYTYENSGARSPVRYEDKDTFDERSLYRSPENLDVLLDALKHGKALTAHSEPLARDDDTLQSVDKQLEGFNFRLESISNQLFQVASRVPRDNDDELPPPLRQDTQDQLQYIEDALRAVEQSQQHLLAELDKARDASTSELSAYWKEQATEYEDVCQGLWDRIRTGHEEGRQRKLQRRRFLEAAPDAESELAEMSPDEDAMPAEFTLNRFQHQIEDIFRRESGLKERQSILRRQIKQQRELNEKSDAEKEEEFMRLRGEIDKLRHRLHDNLSDADALQGEESARRRAAEERVSQLEAALAAAPVETEAHMAGLSRELDAATARAEDATAAIAQKEERVAQLEAALAAARERADARVADLEEESARALEQKEGELAAADTELRRLESEVVRLQTELTMAKAELDGAYGSRAQRAAEVASNPEIKHELQELGRINANLTTQVAQLSETHAERERLLRDELRDTVGALEELTKAGIESEKEREGLESTIDSLRSRTDSLEAQLSDEKMRLLGTRSPTNLLPETTSTKVLRDEFRRMMRESRAEAAKVLRTEQDERKRLEQMIRQLKKDQIPPSKPLRAGLNRSMTTA